MSNKVDERITRIRFDNDQFEKGVATSLQSIDRLKNKLESTESVRAFEGLQKSADKTDLSGIAKAVDTISDKFSVLRGVAIGVLTDITKKAIEAGASIAKSLSMEDMIAGWQKYDQEIQAVQTIMVTLDDTPIEEVEAALQKIGWFSDETSYSYEQMVNSMSKFISSGASLDAAADAVLGVANAAAAAGVTTKNAERAFYNFSQAMGVGYMQLMDWRSIENLNMATPEFKRNILETAAALGKIVKIGDDLYKMEGETDPDNFFTSLSMSQSLKDKWFDKDVILEVSKLYSGFANQVYEVQDAMSFDTASETMDWLDKTGQAIDNVSNKAFRAAQEAKTFGEAIGSVKDALGTKWKDTFKEIFGNYEDATKLWTRFANELYDLVATSSDARNEILKQWNNPSLFLLPEERLVEIFEFPELKSGRDILLEGLWDIYYSIVNVVNAIKSAWNQVFPEMTAKRLYFMTKRFRSFSKRILEFTEDLDGLEKFLSNIFKGIKNSYGVLWPVVKKSWDYLKQVFQDIWSFFKGAWEYLKPNDVFEGLINTVDGLWNLWQSFSRVGSVIIEAWKEVFPDIGNWFIVLTTKFKEITEKILGATEDLSGLKSFLTGIFKILNLFWGLFKKVLNFFEGALPVLQKIWDVIRTIGSQVWTFFKDAWNYLKETEAFSWIINRIEEDLTTLKETLLSFDPSIIKLPTFEDFLTALQNVTTLAGKFGKVIGSAFEWIRKRFKKFLPAKAIAEVTEATEGVTEAAVLAFEVFTSPEMAQTRANVEKTGTTIVTTLSWLKENVGKVLSWISEKLQNFDLKEILATSILGAVSWFTIKAGSLAGSLSKSLGLISEAVATGVGSILSNVGMVVGGFSGMLAAYTKNIKAQTVGEYIGYIRSISFAILAIVGAIYIFNKIEDPEGKITSTIKIIGLLGAGLISIVVILAFVSNKLNTYSKGVNTNFSLFNARGITVTGPKSNGILSLVLGILGLVLAFKWMYDIMYNGDISKSQVLRIADTIIHMAYALTVCIIAMQAVSAILNKFVGAKVTISSFAPLALSGAILLMIRAFKQISELDLESIEVTIWKLIEVFGVMLGLNLALRHLDAGTGFGMLGIALSILIFIRAIKWIQDEGISIDLSSPIFWILGSIIVILGLFSVIAQRGQILNKGQKLRRVSANMIGVVVGLAAFVAATWILGKMEREQLIQGGIAAILAIIVLMGTMIAMVAVAGRVGQYAGKGLLGLTILMAVTTAMFGIVALITYLDREHYEKALAAMGVLFGGILAILLPFIGYKDKVTRSAWTLSFLIISLGGVVTLLYLLSKDNPERLLTIVASMSILMISLGGMAFLISKMNSANTIVNSYQILQFVGYLLLELGVVVGLLSYFVKDNPALMKAAGAMSILAFVIGIITALLGSINIGNTYGAVKVAAAFAIVAGTLGAVVIALSQWVNGENLSFLKTYGKELLCLSGVLVTMTVIMSLLGLFGPALMTSAITGALTLTVIILLLNGLFSVIYLIGLSWSNNQKEFENLAETLYLIGQALGSFFGGLTAGKNKAKIDDATDSVKALTPFAEAMLPLSDAFAALPTDFDAKALAFKNGIKELKGVSGEFKNVQSFTDMLTALDELAPKFRSIAEKVTESDFGNLSNLGSAVETIRNINQWVYGIKNEEVTAITAKFEPIVQNLAALDPGQLTNAIANVPRIIDVLTPLGELFDTLGEIGIKGNIFTGKYIDGFNDVVKSIDNMADVIPVEDLAALKPMDLDQAAQNSEKLSKVLVAFSSVLDSMPKTGGAAGFFAGEEITTFNRLPEFADAVIRYGRQLMATENIQPVNSAIGVTTDLGTAFRTFMAQDMPSKLHDVAVAIGELATAGVDKVATFFTDNRAIGAVSSAIGNLVEAFRNEINAEIKNNRISSFLQILYSTILDSVNYQALNFYLRGKMLHDEFIRGVIGESFDAAQAGIVLAKGLTDSMTNGLEEKSPSKVTFKIGEYAGLGLALGSESMTEEAKSAGESIARAYGDGMSNYFHSKLFARSASRARVGIVDKISSFDLGGYLKEVLNENLGGVFNLDGTDVDPEKLLDEYLINPVKNKTGELKKVFSGLSLEDILSGDFKTKIGDALSNAVSGSMDSAAISSASGEAITKAMLEKIPGITNVEEVLAENFAAEPEQSWVDNLFDTSNLFDFESWMNDIESSYMDMYSTMSSNPISEVFNDMPTYSPSSYLADSSSWQNMLGGTSGGIVAGYTSEDVQALTREIYGLEEALYSLKETMKEQHMVHSGEIRVKYTNESDFIDRVQTAIISSVRREARG